MMRQAREVVHALLRLKSARDVRRALRDAGTSADDVTVASQAPRLAPRLAPRHASPRAILS